MNEFTAEKIRETAAHFDCMYPEESLAAIALCESIDDASTIRAILARVEPMTLEWLQNCIQVQEYAGSAWGKKDG